MSTFEKVKEIMVDTLGCGEDEVLENATLNEDLGADSLAAVEIIMALEDEFDISVPEDASKDIKTVRDLVRLVESLSQAE